MAVAIERKMRHEQEHIMLILIVVISFELCCQHVGRRETSININTLSRSMDNKRKYRKMLKSCIIFIFLKANFFVTFA